ncbi:2-isopropylmalate synthase, partial [Staphylococcus aureus]
AVCGLARCKKSDIDAVYETTKDAAKPVVHFFIETSPIHLEHKLKMSQEDVLASIKEHVTYAKQLFDVVQFSPEDATRTELPFLVKCVQTAFDAGATVINIPDTVGYRHLDDCDPIFKTLPESVRSSTEI